MAPKLFVVHGSHPCAAVQRALELKGMSYHLIELPPPLHAPIQRALFGSRTVPAMRLDSGEKVSGSRAIMRRLEELAPDPPLYRDDADADRAEAWGDAVWQPIARRLLWSTFARAPRAMRSYQAGSRYAWIPPAVVDALAPTVIAAERRLNRVDDGTARADLHALPGHLDRIDGWLQAGVLGGRALTAADLQVASTSRLMLTIGDLRPLFAGRWAEEHALRVFPGWAGSTPAGAFPADWLPAQAAA